MTRTCLENNLFKKQSNNNIQSYQSFICFLCKMQWFLGNLDKDLSKYKQKKERSLQLVMKRCNYVKD